MLVSSADRIAEARVWRKRYGAGMRQVGILAAAGRYALAHHVDRLADDHDRAQRLAKGLGADPSRVPTNIVVLDVADAAAVAVAAARQGVLVVRPRARGSCAWSPTWTSTTPASTAPWTCCARSSAPEGRPRRDDSTVRVESNRRGTRSGRRCRA